MTLIDDTVAELGRSLGMEGLRLRDNGTLVLDMQRHGRLSVELIGDRREDVSLGLFRPVEPPDAEACGRLLELCHYRTSPPFPIRAGLTGRGDLLFAVRMDTSQFTLPNIHEALNRLMSLQDQASTFLRAL